MDIKTFKLWCAFAVINAKDAKIQRYRKLSIAMLVLNVASIAFAVAAKMGYI